MDEHYWSDEFKTKYLYAFKEVVFSVLIAFLSTKKKKLIRNDLAATKGLDAFLPNGFLDDTPTYVDIKYTRSETTLLTLNDAASYSTIDKASRLLIVVSLEIPQDLKKQLEAIIRAGINREITLWDINDLLRISGNKGEEVARFLIAPQRAFVQKAINNTDSEQQKAKQQKKLVEILKDKYQKGDVVLVLGAGVSMSSGIPDWETLVSYLLYGMIQKLLVDKKAIMPSNKEAILKMATDDAKRKSPLLLMRYIRTALESQEYNLMVKEALYLKKPLPKSNLFQSICSLCRPSRRGTCVDSVITYNFDDLLETILTQHDIEFTSISRESDEKSSEVLNIYHVHGYLPQNIDDLSADRGLVFSEEDYHHIYSDAYCWSNIIQINSFRDKTCLFIGSSITDPNMRRLLDVASRHDEKPRHFAFMLRPHVGETPKVASTEALRQYREIDESIWRSYYQALGINVIWVDSYDEIPIILNSLISKQDVS